MKVLKEWCMVVAGTFTILLFVAGCNSHQKPRLPGGNDIYPDSALTVAAKNTTPQYPTVDQFDLYGAARDKCRDLYDKTLYKPAMECCQTLWKESGDSLSQRGQIELLRLMGEIYSATKNYSEAGSCYFRILEIDPYWLPRDFDRFSIAYREPIIEAYSKHGHHFGRKPDMQNIALLDFVVADATPGELDISRLGEALADYVNAVLVEELKEAQPIGTTFNVVSVRERMSTIEEIAGDVRVAATTTGQDNSVVHATIKEAGEIQAVQGFLQGSITRIANTIMVAFYIIDVETGINKCSSKQEGDVDDLFTVVHEALSMCLSCMYDVSMSDEWQKNERAPMQKAVNALVYHHEALIAREENRLDVAKSLAQSAVTLMPNVEEFRKLLDDIVFAEKQMTLTVAVDLPGLPEE